MTLSEHVALFFACLGAGIVIGIVVSLRFRIAEKYWRRMK